MVIVHAWFLQTPHVVEKSLRATGGGGGRESEVRGTGQVPKEENVAKQKIELPIGVYLVVGKFLELFFLGSGRLVCNL